MEVLLALLILGLAACLGLWLALWLVTSTPLLRWCMYGGLAYLGFQVLLLSLQWAGKSLGRDIQARMLEEELRAKVDVPFVIWIGRGRYADRFAMEACGTVTNHADRPVRRIYIACRAQKLSFGESETAGNHFPIAIYPGETKEFAGPITNDLSGIIKTGFRGMQPPDLHFCRLAQVDEGDGS